MKKFIAFICALVLVCSIAAVTLAACDHPGQTLVYSTITRTWTEPRWVQCAYNPYMHAHTIKYMEKANVYYCHICDRSYVKYVTVFLSETCPCVH